MLKFLNTAQLFQRNPLYGLTLRGKVPGNLISIPLDLWPGDFQVAKCMIAGDYVTDTHVIPVSDILNFMANPNQCPKELLVRLHSFEWLRDLRSISTNQSRKFARELIQHWISFNHSWSKKSWLSPAWRADIMGHRLSNWISLFDFFGSSADDQFRDQLLTSICQQYQHLQRVHGRLKNVIGSFLCLKGLLFCAATLPKQKGHIPHYIKLLEKNLKRQIMPDGGHISRSPILQAHILKDLIDLRSLLGSHQKEDYLILQNAIQSLAPIVRLFRHGDGGLAQLKGDIDLRYTPYLARSTTAGLVDTALSLSDVRGRPSGRADYMGYERCSNKNSVLLLNTKVSLHPYNLDYPLDQGINVLDFEWSVGRQRIVQKGDILVQTTPHEFLKLHNQTAGHLNLRRHNEKQIDYIFADYDQFFEGLSYRHQRELYLPDQEGTLKGHDILTLSEKSIAAVRFCLHDGFVAEVQSHKTVKLTLELNAKKSKKSKPNEKVYILTAQGTDDILIDLSPTGAPIINMLMSMDANTPRTIRWAFQEK